jgi:AcrR family transcriptional regulator
VPRGVGRKEQIVAEAGRLFARNGFDAVTVKQIAAACGITEPAVYRHFPSKEAVCSAVLHAIKDRLDYEEVFRQLERETDVETLLRGLALHILSFFAEHFDIYRLLLFSALRGHDRAKQTYDAIRGTYQRFLKAQLDRLEAEGLIIKKNNEITARCFVGMVFDCALGITLWKGMQGRVYEPEDVVANNVPIYARGLKK